MRTGFAGLLKSVVHALAVIACLASASGLAATPSIAEFVASSSAPSHFRLSPDGKKLAWTELRGGIDGIWVRNIGGNNIADSGPGVRVHRSRHDFLWAADSRHLIVAADRDGDENHHLWLIDTALPKAPARDLTPYERVNAALIQIIQPDAKRVVIQHNRRDERVYDLYEIHLDTLAEKRLAENPGSVSGWIVDQQGRLRARINQNGDSRYLEVADGATPGGWKRMLTGAVDDDLVVHGLSVRGDALLLSTNYGRDKIVLAEISLASGQTRVIHVDKTADLDIEEGAVQLAPVSRLPLVAASEPDYPNARVLHPALARALTELTGRGPARVRVFSMDTSERLATVEVYDGLRTRSYLLDLATTAATMLTEAPRVYPAQTRPVQFVSRDGLTIHGYLTLPINAAQKPLPVVVRVHGGPWYRDIWGNTDFAPAALQVQFLASLGYAVLQINFRGSTGYGREFTAAAVGQFGGAMLNDIEDGVRWAIGQGIVNAKKVAIMGTSYGGYATLMSLASMPATYACGVAISAATDLATLIESFPANWALQLKQWHKFVGDPADARQRRIMDTISPVNHAKAIMRPLFMAHGDNDPRVRLQQANSFVHALRAAGGSVDYRVFKGEGHVISRTDSRIRLYEDLQRFLADCLQ